MRNFIESPSLFPYFDGENKNKTGYRKEISLKCCEEELKDDLPRIFKALQRGINAGIDNSSKPSYKCRGFDASTINTWILTEFANVFPGSVIKGRYGRQFIHIHGYLICIKKLDKKGMPMNVSTSFSEAMLYQKKSDLLNDPIKGQNNPILVLGYMIDKFGNVGGYSLSYIKGYKLWSITSSDVLSKDALLAVIPTEETATTVKLRDNILANKKAN